MLAVLPSHTAGHKPHNKGKITCSTCQLKKCVGRCRWEPADCSRPAKRKAA